MTTNNHNNKSKTIFNTTPAMTNTPSDTNSELFVFAGVAIVLLILIKSIVQAASSSAFVLLLPLVYFYLIATCPVAASFHVKQELKRVLRGHHLPEQHPDKPVGFFQQTVARLTATVTTELVTATGYEQSTLSLAGGAAWWQTVRVGQREFYWLGAAHRWWYLFSRELSTENDNNKRS